MDQELYPELYNHAAVEMASEKDRKYFLTHPKAKEYTREFIQGEAPLKDVAFTEVTQVMPGVRARRFYYKNGKAAN